MFHLSTIIFQWIQNGTLKSKFYTNNVSISSRKNFIVVFYVNIIKLMLKNYFMSVIFGMYAYNRNGNFNDLNVTPLIVKRSQECFKTNSCLEILKV